MIRNLLLCDVSLVGAIGVAAPANADQYDFVSFLDNNGVYYDSISDVIDLGKAVCTSTRRTGATDMAINGLVAAGYYSDVERGAILIGAADNMCPDLARDQRPRGADCSRAGSSAAHARRASRGRAIATAHELVSAMTPEQSQRYGGLVQAVNTQAVSSTKSGLPADVAAKVIAKAVTERKPRTRYTVGRDAALITRLARFLPDRTLDYVLAAALRPHSPEESKHHDSATARR